MKIKRISCQYFMNFGEWNDIYIDEDKNIISVIGEWENEPGRSNRSGKSSFVEMMLYALYGKTRAKKEIDLINKNFVNEDLIVELEFDNGIVITRGRTFKNEIILNLSNFEGADKRVVQEEINRIIGMSYDDFIMTSFFVQGNIHTFMDAGPTGQKQMLSKWLEKDYWKKFEKIAKDKIAEIDIEIYKLQVIADDNPDPKLDKEIANNITILEAEKDSIEAVLDGLNIQLAALDDKLKDINEIESLENDIKSISKEITDIVKEISELGDNVKSNNDNLKIARSNKVRINDIGDPLSDLAKIKIKIKTSNDAIKEKNKQLFSSKADFKRSKDEYNSIDKFNSICPVTKLPCDSGDMAGRKSEIIKEGRVLKKNISKFENELKYLEIENVELSITEDTIKDDILELDMLKNKPTEEFLLDEIKLLNKNIENKQELLKDKKEICTKKQERLDDLNKINFEKIKNQKKEINLQIIDNKNEFNDIINRIATLKAELNQIKERRRKSVKAQKDINLSIKDKNLFKIISFMFSKNGIPSNQVETAFSEIEDEANMILDYIESGISIEFTPDKELKTWEENCLVCNFSFPSGFRGKECPECKEERKRKKKDELNINIFTNNNQIDFNLESGGGKVLISLAIRLAFVRMLRRRLGINFNVIVFDEVFGMLDSINRGHIIKLLTTMLINEFSFDQIFVISHEESVRDSLPNIIKVIKYKDYSEFNWD